MTTSNIMSLPVDIPWKRLGTSKDMMDDIAGDRKYPAKWRSSLSVFYHEPPKEEQKLDDRIITYIKVSCTVTGLQAGGSYDEKGNLVEVSMPPKDLFPPWKWKPWENYNKEVRAYYPCYGAMLQVAVFPGSNSEPRPPIEKYPFICDFEPKKREMYESATEANELMSQSRSGISVKKGTTTTDTQEKSWSLGGSMEAAAQLSKTVSGKLGLAASGGEKSGTSTETVDMTTADYSREKRENYSFTTNLSQMYHLLNSYHVGTNRAMFLVLPRPHIVDSEYTFVRGPRRLEGIQEFFLVVQRPKDVPGLCVEATLETAHLGMETAYVPMVIPVSDLYKNENYKKTSETLSLSDADKGGVGMWLEQIVNGWWVSKSGIAKIPIVPVGVPFGLNVLTDNGNVCLRRGWNNLGLDERAKLMEGYKKGSFADVFDKPEGNTGYYTPNKCDLNKMVAMTNWSPENVGHLMGLASAVLGHNEDVGAQNATVVYELVHRHNGTLFLTGRTTFNCIQKPSIYVAKKETDSLTYEKMIDAPLELDDPYAKNKTRAGAANRLVETIGHEMIASLSSADRLPYGEVGVSEASFVQEPITKALADMPDDDPYNVKLSEIEGLDRKLRGRMAEEFGVKTRKEALGIDLYQLRTALGISEVEARRLRTRLIGKGPLAELQPGAIIVPNVEGTPLEAARKRLTAARLGVAEKVAQKDGVEPRDIVLNQFPNAGTTVGKGEIVNLVVSSGPVVVPDVLGINADEATARLQELSLRAERSFAISDEQPEGHILETTPSANTEVPRNSQVLLLVAKKPQTETRETRGHTIK